MAESQNPGQPPSSTALLDLAKEGDSGALGALLEKHRPRLRRLLETRADPRAFARFDRSDVIQETFMEASGRFQEFRLNPAVPFFVWLRFLALQKLMQFHRQHLGAKKRDAGRDVSLAICRASQPSSEYLAAHLLSRSLTPSRAVIREEVRSQLTLILDAMESNDREILCLRHFEKLSNIEAAAVLEVTPSGASSRYVRALGRFRNALEGVPGLMDVMTDGSI